MQISVTNISYKLFSINSLNIFLHNDFVTISIDEIKTRDPCKSLRWVLSELTIFSLDFYSGETHKNFQECHLDSSN